MKNAGNILRICIRLVMACVILIGCVIIVENMLRCIYPLQPVTPLQFRHPDPTYGWRLEPGAQYTLRSSGKPVQVAYNSKGWRDVEHDTHRTDEGIRVLVLGDSYMEGYSVNFEDSFPSRLQSNLEKISGEHVEVINMGVGGYGTLQEYLVFLYEGIQYRPDAVLLAFHFGNDLRNNSYELETMLGAKTRMKVRSRPFVHDLGDGSWNILIPDYLSAKEQYDVALHREQMMPRFYETPALVSAFRRVLKRFKKSPEKNKHYLSAKWGVYWCQEPGAFEDAWRITSEILKKLKHAIEGSGAKLVVFGIPAREDIDLQYRQVVMKKVPGSHEWCFNERRYESRLMGILSDLDIRYLSLMGAFKTASAQGSVKLFGSKDNHWNEAGHAVAAREVANQFTQTDTAAAAWIRGEKKGGR